MAINANKEDGFLVEACLTGDGEAFKKLLDRYLKSIYDFLYYLTTNKIY